VAEFGQPGKGIRRKVMHMYDYTCASCGITGEWKDGIGYCTIVPENFLSVDHIAPLSAGGTNDINNLQILCTVCNSTKGTKLTGRGPLADRTRARSIIKDIAALKSQIVKLEGELMSVWGLT
jgi:5-methylcytosine-specific restriction enzyme A